MKTVEKDKEYWEAMAKSQIGWIHVPVLLLSVCLTLSSSLIALSPHFLRRDGKNIYFKVVLKD